MKPNLYSYLIANALFVALLPFSFYYDFALIYCLIPLAVYAAYTTGVSYFETRAGWFSRSVFGVLFLSWVWWLLWLPFDTGVAVWGIMASLPYTAGAIIYVTYKLRK